MALSLSSRPLVPTKPPFNACNSRQPAFKLLPNEPILRSRQPISAVHAAEPAKTPIAADKPPKASPPHPTAKWSPESWRTKKALQIPEYPDQSELESVLRTIEAFPPLVFAGEARILEERLAEAAMGKAFLLQGGDCAESFKEFNEINIRDSFRLFLRMSVVLMFGGHLPVIKIWFCWNDSMKQQSCKSKKLVRS